MNSVPRERRWFVGGLVRRSLYTQLVTLGVHSKATATTGFGLLDLVRRAPAPGSLGWKRFFFGGWGIAFSFMGMMAAFLATMALRHMFMTARAAHNPSRPPFRTRATVELIVLLSTYTTFYAMSLRGLALARFYRLMLNLRSGRFGEVAEDAHSHFVGCLAF